MPTKLVKIQKIDKIDGIQGSWMMEDLSLSNPFLYHSAYQFFLNYAYIIL